MAKRKDFVSDGLVTLRHKYVAEELEALKGNDDVSAVHSDSGAEKNLSIQEQQIDAYHQMKNDLDIRIQEELATLDSEIELEKQSLNNHETALKKFDQIIGKFASLPESKEIEENSDALTRLEQLRVEFFSIKAAAHTIKKPPVENANTPATNSPQISLLPELNSLTQMQMLRMGLSFALPLIAAIIIGCIIIAWVIIITLGRG